MSGWPEHKVEVELNSRLVDKAGTVSPNVLVFDPPGIFSYDNRGRFLNHVDMLGSTELFGTYAWYQGNNNVGGISTSYEGTWEYTYDGFNRLSAACQPSATCVGTPSSATAAYNYSYDPAGNRWTQKIPSTCSGCVGPQPNLTFNSKNQITNDGVAYDAAGNVINDGSNTYTYDAENRLITVNGSSQAYFYDAFGRQVQDIYNGNTYSRIFGLNGRTEVQFVGTTWMLSELYAGSVGGYLGNYSNNTTYFAHNDQVGTRRRYTDATGNIAETCTGLPFGDGSSCTGGTGSITAFTGQDWDPNTNLTRFPARNYSTQWGLWMHPDPAGLAAVDITNPQSWNRYAYVGNNPVSFTDPTGLQQCSDAQSPAICQPGSYANAFFFNLGTWNQFDLLENPIPVTTYGWNTDTSGVSMSGQVGGVGHFNISLLAYWGEITIGYAMSLPIGNPFSPPPGLTADQAFRVQYDHTPIIHPDQADAFCTLTAEIGNNGYGSEGFHAPDPGNALFEPQGEQVWNNPNNVLPSGSEPPQVLNPNGVAPGEGAGGGAALFGYAVAVSDTKSKCMSLYAGDVAAGNVIP